MPSLSPPLTATFPIPPHAVRTPWHPSPPELGDHEPTLVRFKAPATCGELIQGWSDGQDFLVNCPIDLYAYAELQPAASPGVCVVDAAHHTKIDHGLSLLAEQFADRWPGASGPRASLAHQVQVRSRIPRGKGMASSSADLSAALQAVCVGCGLDLSPQAFTELLIRIEPSDCVHLPGIAHVNHLSGRLYDSLPTPGDLSVVVVDCGGEIDTLAFDRERARDVYRRHADTVGAMLATLGQGLCRRDEGLIGAAATQSAILSQSILPKPQFEALLRLGLEWGALGVNCAHSGTVLGVLHRTRDGLAPTLIERIDAYFGRTVTVLGNHHIVTGGCLEY